MLSLVGPDWDAANPMFVSPNGGVTLVVVDGVAGVYTSMVQLDSDEIWTK
jgi:hypothetical protein